MSLVVLVGRSGSGKSSVSGLMQMCLGYSQVVTCTTRLPREGERDGIDYHFLSKSEFYERLSYGEFAEHTTFAGNWYGTLKNDLYQPNKKLVIIMDQQGASYVKKLLGREAFVVGLEVDTITSRAAMESRSDSSESVNLRSKSESLSYKNLSGVCDHIVNNNGHTKTIAQVTAEVNDHAELFFSRVS